MMEKTAEKNCTKEIKLCGGRPPNGVDCDYYLYLFLLSLDHLWRRFLNRDCGERSSVGLYSWLSGKAVIGKNPGKDPKIEVAESQNEIVSSVDSDVKLKSRNWSCANSRCSGHAIVLCQSVLVIFLILLQSPKHSPFVFSSASLKKLLFLLDKTSDFALSRMQIRNGV
jgi:hypothetical protein